MNILRLESRARRVFSGLLLCALAVELVSGFGSALIMSVKRAAAAVVVIEGAANTDPTTHSVAGSKTVFIDDLVGYHFYANVAANDDCRYRKTTNGGASWGSPVIVDNQVDCIGIAVWYDQWTPGDTGSLIHIVTMDSGDDDLFYNSLNTANDTLGSSTARAVEPVASTTASYAQNANRPNITKTTDGTIYVVADDGNGTGSTIRQCASNCTITANWTDAGTPPQGNADSWSMLMPVANDDVMLINRSTGAVIRYSVWDGTSWTSFQNIAASAPQNTTYDVAMAATLNTDSGDVYLAYVADADNFTTADHDVRTAVYSGGSWTDATNVVTNTSRGIHQVAISRDQNTGNIYVAYSARAVIGTAATSSVYWHRSTDSMSTWGSENGPVNSTPGDFYGMDMNLMSYDRIYATWYDNVTAVRDIFGETIADIGPEVRVSATGTQATPVRADTSNLYVGGTFALQTIATRTLSTVVVTENGSVDATTELDNIKLLYEYDTSAPYNCASESYAGSESQFGSTETAGFSGANGTASFNSTPLSFTPTASLCLYLVLDILPSADDADTLQIEIANPSMDVVVSDVTAFPSVPVALTGTTTIADPNLTLGHYHWRNDDGNEAGATSATVGVQDTPLIAIQKNSPRRLRLGVSNEGSTSSLPVQFVLEYGVAAPTCSVVSTWTTVDSGALWNVYDSSNLTNGADTTNIGTTTAGGVTDENSVFLTPNGGVRDTTATSGVVTLATNNFVELEYSIVASTTAAEGETYCFRVTRSGTPLGTYSQYPQATVAADVSVTATGTQATSTDVGASNVYLGGTYRLIENTSSRQVTSLVFTETGSVDGLTGLANIQLRYDTDTSAPYNCASESYTGSEPTFGATASAFTTDNGTITFNDSVTVSTTSTLCLYVEYDVTTVAAHNQTVDIKIASPNSDVIVSAGGSVGPSTVVDVSGSTTLRGGILTQTHYHWRTDNGDEPTASSATNGLEDTALTEFSRESNIRLRLGVSNEGPTTTSPTALRLEYGIKITTCANVGVWTDVGGSSDEWDMYNSPNLAEGDDTTNIATSTGGVTDENSFFLTPNGGVRDVTSVVATTTLSSSEFAELEFSMTSTENTAFETTYCFRVTAGGVALPAYNRYAEIVTAPQRDFKIQRGTTTVTGAATTITAGIDYVAPASTSSAFIRITNTFDTGAGRNTGGVTQNADDVTAFIRNPGNLLTSITFARPTAAINNTRVSWEIIEYIGESGTDNEMIVRDAGIVGFSTSALSASSSVISGVADSSDVVVYVTGAITQATTQNFYTGQFTSEWSSSTQQAAFRRGASSATFATTSYAVVEFVGANWSIQRVEHTYGTSSIEETKEINPVNSLAHTFIYAQKRTAAQANVVNYGHEVWLNSISELSLRLEPTAAASTTLSQVSVVWVIENAQQGNNAMKVQRKNGNTSGGTAPLSLSVSFLTPIKAMNNTSIFGNSRAAGANTQYPHPHAGLSITSTTTFQIWRSATAAAFSYRVEIVEWPVTDIGLRQNYFRLYTHNNALTPDDAWPAGPVDIGDNETLGTDKEPLARGEKIRVRMSVRVSNANMPAGLRAFKLQYGLRTTTCPAVSVWNDVGAAASSTIWRGFTATGTTDGSVLSTDPPNGADLVFPLISDVAGRLTHQNPSAANPYVVEEGEDVEYDWHLQHNGALPRSTYCFRMVQTDDTALDGYLQYPQIRTAGYNPVSRNWRWYSDVLSVTPTSTLAAENTAPIDIANGTELALRVTVVETKDVAGTDIRFRLQFSEDATFATPRDVIATSSCTGLSLWCYTPGGASDHALLASSTLSDADSCTSGVGLGCGRQVSAPTYKPGHTHTALAAEEHAFTIRHAGARVKAVYYFRLYDTVNGEAVPLGGGESYPSLITEGPQLVFGVSGLPSGTTTAGVVTDASTTPEGIGFGSLSMDVNYEAAHRLSVTSNATEGYQVLFFARQPLLNSSGDAIAPIVASNTNPVAWITGCPVSTSTGCVAYHTTDATLRGGSARFAPDDSYAGLSQSPQEIMHSSIPSVDSHDIVYRVRVGELQPAGDYETEVVYLAVPIY
jgi:hypothetical protein